MMGGRVGQGKTLSKGQPAPMDGEKLGQGVTTRQCVETTGLRWSVQGGQGLGGGNVFTRAALGSTI